MALSLVWAQTPDGVIGADGTIPWHVPEDMARFRALTTGHFVIMGRRTWQSLPRRPLPGRDNIVVSATPGFTADGATVVSSVDQALAVVGDRTAWVIGGAGLYAATLALATRVETTVVDLDVTGDTHAPELGPTWTQVACDPPEGWHTSVTGTRYRFVTHTAPV
ncbi:MAG: dihydrofolate reductase [Micrococcales bacterium]|nr:dihydrofolate reductase [Micrococcales bacterium]